MAEIKKNKGITPSEQYLAERCEKSFLSLWSYPNVYRSDGKEVCDLLVVFGDDVLIFSDKSCAFPNAGNEVLDWRRWYQRSIEKSADQIFGAERWIKTYPQRLYLDARCTQPFPMMFADPNRLRFHRIVVALGAGERCRRALGGSGSLMLAPFMASPLESRPDLASNRPFCIGQVRPKKGFVHVLDDFTLGLLLLELDTITDFVRYLVAKEAWISSGKLHMAAGEEEILAHYLMGFDRWGVRPGFPELPHRHRDRSLALDEGFWRDWSCSARRWPARPRPGTPLPALRSVRSDWPTRLRSDWPTRARSVSVTPSGSNSPARYSQFHAACGGNGPRWAAEHDLCLLLSHHPPEWLGERARIGLSGDIAPPGRFAAQLFGHMHEGVATTRSVGGAEERRVVQAYSLFGLEHFESDRPADRRYGYLAGQLRLRDKEADLRLWPRIAKRHSDGHFRMEPDTDSFELLDDQGTAPRPVVRH